MADLTLPVKEKIAVVFDFDETLAPPTHLKMLEKTGIDQKEREDYIKKLLDEGWDKILARAYSWVKYSQEERPPITRQMFREIGEEMSLFDGVDTLFDRLRSFCPDDEVEMEFYLLTAGFVEIPRATVIAHEFKNIWGGAYAFDDDDKLIFISRILTHEQKREYLQQLAKGTGLDGPSAPSDSHQFVEEENMHIPFPQIIYVGDGASDRPAFSLLHEKGGVTIGLAKNNDGTWKERDRLKKNQKVDNLLAVDYTEDSELMRCLKMAIESICQRIMLRKIGKS